MNYLYFQFLDLPAVVSSSFAATHNLTEGDNLTLSCNISGNPTPEINWVRDAAVGGSTRQSESTGPDGYFVNSYFEQNNITWLYHDKQISCKGNNSGGIIDRSTRLSVTCKYYTSDSKGKHAISVLSVTHLSFSARTNFKLGGSTFAQNLLVYFEIFLFTLSNKSWEEAVCYLPIWEWYVTIYATHQKLKQPYR